MNSDHLKYLIAIGKERSMAEASEKLFVTPQALSMAIKKLEEELKMPLLSRSTTGTILTENGQWLVERAEQFFGDIEKRQQTYQQYLKVEGIMPNGIIDLITDPLGIGEAKIADIACMLSQSYPDVQINIMERARRDIEQAIYDETIELGFIHRTKFNGRFIDTLQEGIAFYPLQAGELVIQAAPEIQLTKNKAVSLKKITSQRFCIYDLSGEQRIKGLLKQCTGEDIHCLTTNNYALYKAKLESGDYIALSVQMDGDEHCINHLPGMHTWSVRDDISIYFGIIRKNRTISDNMTFIWHKMLAEYGTRPIKC